MRSKKAISTIIILVALILLTVLAFLRFESFFNLFVSSNTANAENRLFDDGIRFDGFINDRMQIYTKQNTTINRIIIKSKTGTKMCDISDIYRVEDSLVGHWDFDDRLAKDGSDNSHHGEFQGDAKINLTNGIKNRYLSLDGYGDFVNVSDSAALSGGNGKNLTISFWMKSNHTSATAYYGLVTKYLDSANKDWGISFHDDWAYFYYENGGANDGSCNSSSVKLHKGKWNHITASFDGSSLDCNFYVNGTLTETTSNSFSLPDTIGVVEFGRNNYQNKNFSGALDDIRIYDRVLSNYEIRAIYNNELYIETGVNELDITSCNLINGTLYNFYIVSTNGQIQEDLLKK